MTYKMKFIVFVLLFSDSLCELLANNPKSLSAVISKPGKLFAITLPTIGKLLSDDATSAPSSRPSSHPSARPTSLSPTTFSPSTFIPTASPSTAPTSLTPTSIAPSTSTPTSASPTTAPTTEVPTSVAPSTHSPTSTSPSVAPTTHTPTTLSPTTLSPSTVPSTLKPTTIAPTTLSPTASPTTLKPTSLAPITVSPSASPTTRSPTTIAPTTTPPSLSPITLKPSTFAPSSATPSTSPTTASPTSSAPTTLTASPTFASSPSVSPSTLSPTSLAPSSRPSSTPSVEPSSRPSVVPSADPSSSPSSTPSARPSSGSPTTLLSPSPTTSAPSMTRVPTQRPSTVSPTTRSPTLSPTSRPPTVRPSSALPTSYPSESALTFQSVLTISGLQPLLALNQYAVLDDLLTVASEAMDLSSSDVKYLYYVATSEEEAAGTAAESLSRGVGIAYFGTLLRGGSGRLLATQNTTTTAIYLQTTVALVDIPSDFTNSSSYYSHLTQLLVSSVSSGQFTAALKTELSSTFTSSQLSDVAVTAVESSALGGSLSSSPTLSPSHAPSLSSAPSAGDTSNGGTSSLSTMLIIIISVVGASVLIAAVVALWWYYFIRPKRHPVGGEITRIVSPKRHNEAMLVNFTEVSRKITSGGAISSDMATLHGEEQEQNVEFGEGVSPEEGSGFDDYSSQFQQPAYRPNDSNTINFSQRVNSWDVPPPSAPSVPTMSHKRQPLHRAASTGVIPSTMQSTVRVIRVDSESAKRMTLSAASTDRHQRHDLMQLSLNRIDSR